MRWRGRRSWTGFVLVVLGAAALAAPALAQRTPATIPAPPAGTLRAGDDAALARYLAGRALNLPGSDVAHERVPLPGGGVMLLVRGMGGACGASGDCPHLGFVQAGNGWRRVFEDHVACFDMVRSAGAVAEIRSAEAAVCREGRVRVSRWNAREGEFQPAGTVNTRGR